MSSVGGPGKSAALLLMVDYAAPTPLWIDNGRAVINDLTPLHLPNAVHVRLLKWQRHFDAHFAVERWPHWTSKDDEKWHAAEGHRLFDELVQALPSRRIALDVWAVDAGSASQDVTGKQAATAGRRVYEPPSKRAP